MAIMMIVSLKKFHLKNKDGKHFDWKEIEGNK